MNRFVVLYQAPLGVSERFAQATPEESAAGMQLWVDWAARTGPALVDPGKPLAKAMEITRDGAAAIDSSVIGMSILRAETMEDAVALVRDHPHLGWAEECRVLVLEEIAIPETVAAGPDPR